MDKKALNVTSLVHTSWVYLSCQKLCHILHYPLQFYVISRFIESYSQKEVLNNVHLALTMHEQIYSLFSYSMQVEAVSGQCMFLPGTDQLPK